MKNKNTLNDIDHYTEELCSVRGVHFTPREIDIIACLLCSRGTNKIASFLSILPKTVRNHIHNIMIKLDCNSRDGIIDFIERSDKVSLLRQHYSRLLIRTDFETSLKEISRLKKGEALSCKIVYWKSNTESYSLRDFIDISFKRLGLTGNLEERETQTPVKDLIKEFHEDVDAVIYINNQLTGSLFCIRDNKAKHKIIFYTSEDLSRENSSFDLITVETQNSEYYDICFQILKIIFPNINIENIIKQFKEKYEIRKNGYNGQETKEYVEYNILKGRNETQAHYPDIFKKSWLKYSLAFTLLVSGCLFAGLYLNNKLAPGSELSVSEHNDRRRFEEERSNLRYIPDLPNHFDKELTHYKALEEKLGDVTKTAPKTVEIFAIVGIAGSGKTTSALWYAGEYEKSFYANQGRDKKHTVVFKLNAENLQELHASYGDLARRLGVDTKQSVDAVIKKVNIKLEQYPGWLLIFDNIRNEASYNEVKRYFPEKRIGLEGKVIITSQDLNLNIDPKHTLNISSGSPKEAAALFLQKHTRINDPDNAHKLVKDLDGLPLSLAVATLYIKRENEKRRTDGAPFTLNDYHKQLSGNLGDNTHFEKVQSRLLAAENAGYSEPYNQTLAVILQLAINSLSQDSRDLLNLCGFISPDCIHKALLIAYLSKIKNIPPSTAQERFELIINEINKYGLLYPINVYSFTIHRTTQKEINKLFLQNMNDSDQTKAIQTLLSHLNDCATSDENEKTLRHVNLTELQQHVAVHLERFKTNLEKYKKNLSTFGELGIRTLINIGVGYKDIGVGAEEIKTSKKYLQDALNMALTQVKSPYYIMKTNYELAIVKREVDETLDTNREKGAISLFKSALKSLSEHSFKDNDHLHAFILHNLAICYVNLNDHESAIRSFQEALPYYNGSPVMLRTYSWLGYAQMNAGKYEEGKQSFELADKMLTVFVNSNQALKEEYLNFLDISEHNYRWGVGLSILASLSNDSNELLRKAIDRLEMARHAREKEKNYRRLALVLDQLAQAYWKVNDTDKATQVFHNAIEVSTKALGADHPTIIELKNNLERIH